MFKKILIVNRGEIAVRIIRACKELDIKAAVIYSEADKAALHTILADEAYFIGPADPSHSYLNQGKIINLAKAIYADAIHPGYGFLSENASFIKAVENADITFIGPSSRSVALMGDKIAARKLMEKNKVPIVPGTTDSLNDLEEARKVAEEFGYPVLLKASAGGGGKGMRKVSAMDELANAFEATKRESLNAFGDDSIYLEKFIQNPRHIEVQVFADKKGNYRHLFERECSIQRRHQKIIEEAPSVFVDPKTRDRITEAALNTAKSCDYFNAGTVEFLMDEQKNFYFLEMNTRLQVEHPVTEMITSTDLVKEQISVAAGNKISFEQKDMRINGSAIECRICAEDPFNDFLPSAGKIMSYHQPSGPGVRIDEGFTSGSEISVYYDSLIAKLVCHGSEREIALGKIKRALDEFNIAGIVTNIPFLKSLFRNSNFIKGEFDISFIEKEMNVITPENSNGIEQAASIISAYLMKMQNQDSRAADKSAKNRWSEQLND